MKFSGFQMSWKAALKNFHHIVSTHKCMPNVFIILLVELLAVMSPSSLKTARLALESTFFSSIRRIFSSVIRKRITQIRIIHYS